MVEPSFLALTTTPSMTGRGAEPTLPASAAADWASPGAARPIWNRTAAVAAVEASNAFRIRMAFPSGLKLVEFERVAGLTGKTVTFRSKISPAGPLLQGGPGVHELLFRALRDPRKRGEERGSQSSGSTLT